MNSLLALILSALIALSGAGALPAVPTTAVQTTVRDICVTLNDETYAIASEPVSVTAIGSDLAAGTFELRLGDEALFPMKASIDKNAIRFTLGDTGRVYTLDEAALENLMGCDDVTLEFIESYCAMIAQAAGLDQSAAKETSLASAKAMKDVLPQVESSGSIPLNGEMVKMDSYSGTLDMEALIGLTEALANSENKAIADYMKGVLEFANKASGTNYADWREALTAETADAEMPDILMSVDIAENGDSYYVYTNTDISTWEDEPPVTIRTEQLLDEGDLRETFEMLFLDDGVSFTMNGTVDVDDAFGDAPEMNFDFGFSVDESYSGENSDTGDTETVAENSFKLTMTGDLKNVDGLCSFNMEIATDANGILLPGAYDTDGSLNIQSHNAFTLTANEAAAENGGKDTNVEMALALDNGERYGASFTVNAVEVPFDAQALYGDGEVEEVLITGAEDDSSPARLVFDVMALANDASAMITGDQGLSDLISVISAAMVPVEAVEIDVEEDWNDFDTDLTFEYLPAEQVMDRFIGVNVTFDAPEGYSVDQDSTYVTGDNTMANIAYTNEDGSKYVELTMFYQDSAPVDYLQLKSDGSSEPIDGVVVSLNRFDEGGYYYASFTKANVFTSLFFSECTLEEAQELLSRLHIAD